MQPYTKMARTRVWPRIVWDDPSMEFYRIGAPQVLGPNRRLVVQQIETGDYA
jgi:hypothetical protein